MNNVNDVYWILGVIYLISVFASQMLSDKLWIKIYHDVKRYKNILEAVRTLHKVSYIPILNTFYFLVVFYLCVKNRVI